MTLRLAYFITGRQDKEAVERIAHQRGASVIVSRSQGPTFKGREALLQLTQ